MRTQKLQMLVAGLMLATTAQAEQPDTAQPAASVDPISQYLNAIEQTEAEGSAYSPALSDLYLGLGNAHQQRGEYDQAVLAYQRGMQVERINQGLNSPTQTPYLFAIADNQSYVGNWKQSQAALENIYQIATSRHGEFNEELLPVLGELMDWYLSNYSRRSPDDAYSNLVISEKIADRMATIIERQAGMKHPQAPGSYRRIGKLHYTIANHLKKHGVPKESGFTVSTGSAAPPAPAVTSQSHFRYGKNAFQKMIQSIEAQPDTTPEQLAVAIAELGDWYLVFGQRVAAKKTYRLAYQILAKTEQGAEQIFAEPQLIDLKIQQLKGSASNATVAVTLDISDRGRPGNIQINEGEIALTPTERNAVMAALRDSRFRPQLLNGEPQATTFTMDFPYHREAAL